MKVRLIQLVIGLACTLFFLAIAFIEMAMVQQGVEILRRWRTLEVTGLTLIIYVPDALSLWFLVKAVGLTLGFSDTLVLLGAAGLSTLVPSGPGFLGTLQCAYALCGRIRRRRSGARHCRGNSRTALPTSPPCADRRRHSSSRLGDRSVHDFGEAAI